jgi:protein arginine phosphatase
MDTFSEIWQDPVLSSIIASLIIAIITYLFYKFRKVTKVKLRNRKKKLLIYVSAGGTCRDPMAKAITLKLLENVNLNYKLEIKSAGLIKPSSPFVSYAARHAIKEIFNDDILAKHKTNTLTKELVEQADLILVMTSELLQQLNKKFNVEVGKAFVFKDFFGLEGDIIDPFPDGKDAQTLKKYMSCANELKTTIEKRLKTLIDAVNT